MTGRAQREHRKAAEHHLKCADDFKPTGGMAGAQQEQWNTALWHAAMAAAHAGLAALPDDAREPHE